MRFKAQRRVTGALLTLGLITGAVLIARSLPTEDHSLSPVAEPTSAAAAPIVDPVRLVIPSIQINAPMSHIGLNPDRSLRPPDDVVHAGWYSGGTVIGATGTSVVAGHYDSKTGPGVFYKLGDAHRGDHVLVLDRSGRPADFVVYRIERYSKNSFPSDQVYGASPQPELRLITCGGNFNYGTRHYEDNVVVYAAMYT